MANPFDQYDNDPPAIGGGSPLSAAAPSTGTPTSGSAPAPAQPNPFDQYDNDAPVFGGPSQADIQQSSASGEPDATLGSTAKQAGYGVLRALPNMAAGLADLGQTVGNVDMAFKSPATGESMFSQLGRDLGLTSAPAPAPNPYVPTAGAAIKAGLGKVGLNTDNLPQPQNPPERVASTVGETAASLALPELAVGRMGLLGRGVADAAAPLLGTGETGSLLANTAKGATVGLGSGAAQEAVPDQYKPAAGIIGGLAGGVAAETPGILSSMGKKVVSLVPVTTGQVESAAGRKLVGAAENPQEAINTIGATTNPELVPGSLPTAGQLTGDKGLLSLEGAAARETPEPFVGRREAQNTARSDALASLQATGDPAQVGSFFRSQLDDIDNQTQSALDTATRGAEQSVSSLGGTQPVEATGAQMRGILDTSVPRMPGLAGQQAADVTGNQMRGALESSIDAMKAREQALWSAVPKDVNVVSAPMKQTVANVYRSMTPEEFSTLNPVEKDVTGFINSYGDQLPFERLNGLRTIVNKGIRDARSPLQPNEAAYDRLSQVRGSINDAIDASLTAKAADEQSAVAAGTMAPEETMVSKWAQEAQSARDEWLRARQDAGANTGTNSSSPGATGQTAFSGASGAKGPSRSGFNNTSSDSGMASGEASRPLINEAGANAVNEAVAATKQRKDLIRPQPISGILQRPYATSPYNVGDALVPGKIWRPGDAGNQTMAQYLAATRNSPEAVAALREAASSSLRSEAVNGRLSEKAFQGWQQKYAAPLQRLEQVSPGITQTFARSANNVGETVGGILSRPDITNGAIPSMVWKNGPKGADAVRDFLAASRNDPRAVSALKEAASNSLMSKVKNGVLDGDKFDAWRQAHAGALQELERAAPGTLASYENAAKASQTIETAAANRKQAMDAYSKSALGRFLDIHDPADITKAVGQVLRGDKAVGKMRQLAQEASKDPAAAEGLRKSVADYITQELVGNTEIGTSGKAAIKADAFQTFVRKNDVALREVMTPEEVQTLHAVAADLQRSARSTNAVKIPGGSDTMQNANANAKHGGGGGGSMLGMLLGGGLGHIAGHGAVGTGLGAVFGAIRKMGMGRVDDLVNEALLNPDLARTLMMKVPTSKGAGISLANRLMRTVATSDLSSRQPQKRPQ